VVGKFVEFYGPGVAALPLADRATIGNMLPNTATCGNLPVDRDLRYLRLTGRSEEQIAWLRLLRAQGLFHTGIAGGRLHQTLELDLGAVEPSGAGPRRPQDRASRLKDAAASSAQPNAQPARAHGQAAGFAHSGYLAA